MILERLKKIEEMLSVMNDKRAPSISISDITGKTDYINANILTFMLPHDISPDSIADIVKTASLPTKSPVLLA
jgi:hypothetical protein